MDLATADAVSRTRTQLAALADTARDAPAAGAYERVLLRLDAYYGYDTPPLDLDISGDDPAALTADTTTSLRALVGQGLDELDVEILLDLLHAAAGLDEP